MGFTQTCGGKNISRFWAGLEISNNLRTPTILETAIHGGFFHGLQPLKWRNLLRSTLVESESYMYDICLRRCEKSIRLFQNLKMDACHHETRDSRFFWWTDLFHWKKSHQKAKQCMSDTKLWMHSPHELQLEVLCCKASTVISVTCARNTADYKLGQSQTAQQFPRYPSSYQSSILHDTCSASSMYPNKPWLLPSPIYEMPAFCHPFCALLRAGWRPL